MQIHIDAKGGVPIYLQIVNQIKHLVVAGRLAPGEEVPAIRSLAEQLLVNPNTVARAYLELERAGLVTKRQGSGTYVSETISPLPQREKLRVLGQRVDALLLEADHLDVPLDDVLTLIKERHEAMQPHSSK